MHYHDIYQANYQAIHTFCNKPYLNDILKHPNTVIFSFCAVILVNFSQFKAFCVFSLFPFFPFFFCSDIRSSVLLILKQSLYISQPEHVYDVIVKILVVSIEQWMEGQGEYSN